MTASFREQSFVAAGLVAAALLAAAPIGHARPSDAADPGMVRVPAGSFFMGERPHEGRDGHAGREVKLPELWIDRTEVTAHEYAACVAARACPAVDPKQPRCNVNAGAADHPANCIEWNGAAAFCHWKGKRLPTSAEWERAARGDDERRYPWGKERPRNQLCWQREERGAARTCPVGAHPAGASPFGVQDMAGNVAEWTATRVPTPFGIEYVVRGGGWSVEDLAMAAPDDLEYRADRPSTREPVEAAMDVGFRCAKGGARDAAADWAPGEAAYVFTPPATSPDQKALVELVRAQMTVAAELKVDWIKMSGDWAYFEAHAVATAKGPGASANALVHRDPGGHWEIAEILVGPGNDDARRADFRARLEARRTRAKLPQGLFSDPGIP